MSNIVDGVDQKYHNLPQSEIGGLYNDVIVDGSGVDDIVDGDPESEVLGSSAVTDGVFETVTDDAGELSSGLLAIGKCYLISARTDGNFQAVGSPDDVVGTYFTATGTGAGLLDAGDKVFPVTFTSWTDTADGLAPGTSAGALTNKASWDGSQAAVSPLNQPTILTAGKLYRLDYTMTRSAGYMTPSLGGAGGSVTASSGTFYAYVIATGTYLQFIASSAFIGTIDSVSVKEVTG